MKNRFLSILLCLSTTLILQAQTVVEMNGKLKLVGKQLSSECGNAVQLRGMSMHGVNHFPNCVKNNAFTSLRDDWKCDIVRLAMYVEETNGYKTDPEGWKAKIDRWVDQIGALGMYCLIDWHTLSDNDPNININIAKDFWDHMSKTHKGKKHVLYEICNEPNGVNWGTIKNYANVIIPIIRANDPETIIIVGTPMWSGKPIDVVNGGPLTGANAYNVMYAFHFYAASHSSYRSEVQSAAGSIPIFATEWGLSDASGNGNINTGEGQLWMDIFNGSNSGSQKISWCNWSFSDKNETSAGLKAESCINQTWTNTTTSGTQVKTWISSPAKSFKACTTTPSCKTPNLGSNVSLCGVSGGITLNSGLPAATNRVFLWKNGTTTVGGNTPTFTANTAGTYTVQVDSAGCSKTDNIVVSATLPSVSLGATAELCNPSTKVLDAGVSGNVSYSWKKGTAVVGGNTKTYTVTEAGTYFVTVSATGCNPSTGTVNITSALPTVKGSDFCATRAPILTATGTGPFQWYATNNSTAILGTGTSFSPNPIPTGTTTYYVQATPGQDYKMGPAVRGTAPWDITGNVYADADKQLIINALGNVTLKSVEVDPQSGAQSVKINVTDVAANTIIKTVTQSIPAAQTAIMIDASLTSGKKYRIDAIGSSGNLYFRNQEGTTLWPQTTANVATVEPNVSGYATNWSLFYNITFSTGKACSRVPVVATFVLACVGIEDETATLSAIKVFPNPSESGFNIQLGTGNTVIQKIELSNIEGRVLETVSKNQISEQFQMGESLPNGQYFLRIVSDNKVIVKPIVKLK